MKLVQTNEGLFDPEGTLWVPDTIAAWDAISHWERERLTSMRSHLRPGMTLIDVGTEHAWWTAIVAQWVGPENTILCEPSPEMWSDIRLTWKHNAFPAPLAVWPGFVGAADEYEPGTPYLGPDWPWWCPDTHESPVVPYRYLHDEGHRSQGIPTITIDTLASRLNVKIDAITVDVEGAEFEVMRGAKETLKRDRPLVWLSVHEDLLARDYRTTDVQELFDFMHDHGYGREFLGRDHEAHNAFFPLEWRPK